MKKLESAVAVLGGTIKVGPPRAYFFVNNNDKHPCMYVTVTDLGMPSEGTERPYTRETSKEALDALEEILITSLRPGVASVVWRMLPTANANTAERKWRAMCRVAVIDNSWEIIEDVQL